MDEEEDGMVVVRISLQGFDVAPRVSWISTIHSDVLVVVIVADIEFS